MAEKVSRDRGYRSDTIAISCDMGPLRSRLKNSILTFSWVHHIAASQSQWCLHRGLHRSGFPQRERKSQWKCIASQRCSAATHIALHKSLGLVQSKALKSHDSHRGLLKYIASQTCIARFGELRPSEFPTKTGPWWVACLQFSISLENFYPRVRSWEMFQSFGARDWNLPPPPAHSDKKVLRGTFHSLPPPFWSDYPTEIVPWRVQNLASFWRGFATQITCAIMKGFGDATILVNNTSSRNFAWNK